MVRQPKKKSTSINRKKRSPNTKTILGVEDLHLEESELDTLEAKSRALMSAILKAAARQGIGYEELYARFDMSEGYFTQLRTGVRTTESVRPAFIDTATEILGWPKIKVLIAAGKVHPLDFIDHPVPEVLIDSAIDYILNDLDFGIYFDQSIKTLSSSVKIGIILMFEQSTGTKLLPKASLEKMIEEINTEN